MNYLRKLYWLIGPNGLIAIIISYFLTSIFQYFKFNNLKINLLQNSEILDTLKNNFFIVTNTAALDLNYNILQKNFESFSQQKSINEGNKKFWVNYLSTKQQKNDAAKLFLNKKVLNLASNYLETFPTLYSISYYKTQKTEDDILSKSQLWHLDTTHKKVFKIFWSPKGVTSNEGPTTICNSGKKTKLWQFLNYPNFPSYFNDAEFSNSILSKFRTKEILLNPSQLSICDTCNLFHYGSRFNKERWIVILEFAPLKRFDYFHKPDKDLDEANKIIASMLSN